MSDGSSPTTGRDLLALTALGADGLRAVLAASKRPAGDQLLRGRAAALVLEKPSTRTRVAFEAAVAALGGHAIVLTPESSQLGRGEPPEDAARAIGGMVAAIAVRTGPTARLEAYARGSAAPVINALTDDAHPLQVLADLATVERAFGIVHGLRYAWVGDASNVARSWIDAAGLLRLELALACPEGLGPPPAEVEAAQARGGRITVGTDARAAVGGANVVLTDVWVSMGFEAEQAARREKLAPYRVDRALLEGADAGVRVLHCLPAHRGEEIAADVLDGEASLAWDAAAMRLPATRAALEWALGAAP